MFVIIGIVVVFGAVVGGYLMEHGNIRVLLQPAELLIIGGAGAGTVLVANPLHVLKKIVAGLAGVFGGSKFTKQRYLDSLKTMYDLFNKARREGLIALESDVEEPDKSPIFSKNPFFLKDHHVRDFICDTMRMAVTGGIEPFDVDQMMEVDMDVHHHGETVPISALSTMADSLPGLGIVAALLAVVITMGALGGPPEENRAQGGGGAGGDILGHSFVLRAGGAGGIEHGEDGGRRACLLSRTAGGDPGIPERHVADHGGRGGSAGGAGTRAAVVPGSRKGAPRRR